MSEFEHFDLGVEDDETELSLARVIMEDPEFLASRRDAIEWAAYYNQTDKVNKPSETVVKLKTNELDLKVQHLLNTSVKVGGTLYTRNQEGEVLLEQEVQDVEAEFLGYYARESNDIFRFMYGFNVLLDVETGKIVTYNGSHLPTGTSQHIERVMFMCDVSDSLVLDFTVIHPTRAAATLALISPRTLTNLNRRFERADSKELEHIVPALYGFRAPVPEELGEAKLLTTSLLSLVSAHTELDFDLASVISLEGKYEEIIRGSTGIPLTKYSKEVTEPRTALLKPEEITLMHRQERLKNGKYKHFLMYALRGYFYDLTLPRTDAQELEIPFDSMSAIRSEFDFLRAAEIRRQEKQYE
jgi:hypothetical protein